MMEEFTGLQLIDVRSPQEFAAGFFGPYTIQARVLEGGVNAWSKNGQPLVRLSGTSWSLERQVRLVAGTLVVFGVTMPVTVS